MGPRNWLSVKEAAGLFGISPTTVYRMVKYSQLEARYFRGAIRVRASSAGRPLHRTRA